MTPRFAAYSFVDRFIEFEPGRRARATFAIPAGVAFPAALIAEAVGQTAAWVAMEHIDFRGRPVAALATETNFRGDARPGDALELEVDIIACDDEAVAYNGRASVCGTTVIELVDCLGPMLPAGDFDSPEALRDRLALLRAGGAAPGRFGGVDDVPVRVTHRVPGVEMRATLDVPGDASFFADHFPRRPVFPATLLLDAQMRLAIDLARESPALDRSARPLRVTHVKMRSFIAPSQQLDIGIELKPVQGGVVRAMMSAASGGRAVATARLDVVGDRP